MHVFGDAEGAVGVVHLQQITTAVCAIPSTCIMLLSFRHLNGT